MKNGDNSFRRISSEVKEMLAEPRWSDQNSLPAEHRLGRGEGEAETGIREAYSGPY